jgi:hypothetical protein
MAAMIEAGLRGRHESRPSRTPRLKRSGNSRLQSSSLIQPRPPAGFIPQQAFDARMAKAEEKFNERYAALEAQLNQFSHQPRPQPVERKAPPDFFENPDAAFQARLQEALSPIIRPVRLGSSRTSRA